MNIDLLDDILYWHSSFVGEELGSMEKVCTGTEIWVQRLSSDVLKQLQDTEWIQKELSREH